MVNVENHAFFWRTEEHKGSLHLALEDETGVDIPLESPQEASFLLNLLMNEEQVQYRKEHGLLSAGFVTESEAKGKKKGSSKVASK